MFFKDKNCYSDLLIYYFLSSIFIATHIFYMVYVVGDMAEKNPE